MRFAGNVLVTHGVTGADPDSAPGSVLESNLIYLKPPIGGLPFPPAIQLALEAPTTEGCTIALWSMFDPGPPVGAPPSDGLAKADRVFYRFATGVALTGRRLSVVTSTLPVGGTIYVQVTADTIASGSRNLFVGWAV